jgi:hypothetical protein
MKCNNEINKVVNKMFCQLLYETVVHITDRVLIYIKTIKHFVNEYELKMNAFYYFVEVLVIMLFLCYLL